ncbi:hypothetical protein DPMN_045598 [Dreissena polymorpha]|uniref:Uncharacterized protein n=1 Tax=Dreissena polymorpha TaxID=45954 RepID=A0A9D4HZS5_DREPO|nr:hypothetical protein DPMN_045598 [Dreissena polymorpha]
MPAISATSAWSSAGSNYYFTYSTVIQKANDGLQDFYYACMQYRCSENQENTNVYLNTDIPMKDMPQEPAFKCVGPCFDARCIAAKSSTEALSLLLNSWLEKTGLTIMLISTWLVVPQGTRLKRSRTCSTALPAVSYLLRNHPKFVDK